MKELTRKYSDLKIILFGDLNCDREKFKKNYISPLELEGYKGIYKEEKEEYTRSEERKSKEGKVIQYSYLDYFMYKGVKVSDFNIGDKLSNSDHRWLEIKIDNESCGKLDKIIEVIEPYQLAKGNLKEIEKRIWPMFWTEKKEEEIKEKSKELQKIIKEFKAKFSPLLREKKEERCILEMKAKSIKKLEKEKDFKGIGELIRKTKVSDMNKFLEQLNTLRIKNDSKEYYLRLRVYSEISKNVDALYNC